MRNVRDIECFLTDMDGVLVHDEQPVPGAVELLQRWVDTSRRFLVLTNNSTYTPRDLAARLARSGLPVPEENLWTSAMATGAFLAGQPGKKTAFVIGEAGLTMALHEAGFVLTETDPAFVVLGETRNYSFEAITNAIRLITRGRPVHRHQPRHRRPFAERPAAGHRCRGRDDHGCDQPPAVCGRQAEPDDVPFRDEPDRGPLRDHRDDR